MKKSPFIFSIFLVMIFVLSACRGRSNDVTTTIDVIMTDFSFTLNRFTIPAGQEITLNATNGGAVEHEFSIFKSATNPGDHFGAEDQSNIYWEVKVLAAESEPVSFMAPTDPGDYFVTCGIPGYLEAGMSAKLIVVLAGNHLQLGYAQVIDNQSEQPAH